MDTSYHYVELRTTAALRETLQARGGLQGGLALIVKHHLEAQGTRADYLSEHQQKGEPQPFAVAISKPDRSDVILIMTYQEAVEGGFYDTGNDTLH